MIFCFTSLVKRVTITVRKFQEVSLWHNVTKMLWSQLMVLKKRTWLSSKVFTLLYATNQAHHCSCYRHTRSSKRVCLDAEVYEELQVDAESLMKEYEKRARDAGVTDILSSSKWKSKNPPCPYYSEAENVDLILVGATGLNAFERLLVGSCILPCKSRFTGWQRKTIVNIKGEPLKILLRTHTFQFKRVLDAHDF